MHKTLTCILCVCMLGLGGRCVDIADSRPVCREAAACVGVNGGSTQNEYEFDLQDDKDHKLFISYVDSIFLKVKCGKGWAALDSDALPAFLSEIKVSRVTLRGCPPPANDSFVHVLSSLNVSLLHETTTQGNLTLEDLPPLPPLQAKHFAGLEYLVRLTVRAPYKGERPAVNSNFLSKLRNLRSLEMQGIQIPLEALQHMSNSLQALSLTSSGVVSPPKAVLSLPNLYNLQLSEDYINVSEVPPKLSVLNLYSNNTTLTLISIPEVENVVLNSWSETHPKVLSQCEKLLTLQLTFPAVVALPEHWVARCHNLESLVITKASKLESLPGNLLKNATKLWNLSLQKCNLKTLPKGLLHFVPNLRLLDLSYNHLTTLSSGTFASQGALLTLNLSNNMLNKNAVEVMAVLQSLEKLNLSHNPHLSNLCDGYMGYSKLRLLDQLKYLILTNTSITHICRDWRDSLTSLETLELRFTKISELSFSELLFTRNPTIKYSVVRLEGTPVVRVNYSERDYNASLEAPRSAAQVQLDVATRLHCDCDMYWARVALFPRAGVSSARVTGLVCASRRRLADVRPDDLECSVRAQWAPRGCRVTARPAPGGRRLVRLHCDSAGLGHVPAVPHTDRTIYDLLLRNNSISLLENLPPRVRVLDIRNNSVERLEVETVQGALREGRVLLSNNSFACDCSTAPLVAALRDAGESASDLRDATCFDRSPLRNATTRPCSHVPLAGWIGVGLAALLVITAFAIVYFGQPERLAIIKLGMHEMGLLQLPPDPPAPEGGFRYDAFLCFAHKDEKVALKFMKKLESGSTPFRLCVHSRDWVPGFMISHQIQESVRVSRRTLILVSKAYFDSDWAKSEFREAYALVMRDVTPRLVVVLLDDPKKLPLDEEMQRYIDRHTYIPINAIGFWKRLRVALGPPLLLSVPPSLPFQSPSPMSRLVRYFYKPVRPPQEASKPVVHPRNQFILQDRILNLEHTAKSISVSISLEPTCHAETPHVSRRVTVAE